MSGRSGDEADRRTRGIDGGARTRGRVRGPPAPLTTGSESATVGQLSANHTTLGNSELPPRLQLYPAVVLRGRGVTIAVTDVDVPSLEVNVAGGTSVLGKPLRWKQLRLRDGAWRGALPLPVLRGVYPSSCVFAKAGVSSDPTNGSCGSLRAARSPGRRSATRKGWRRGGCEACTPAGLSWQPGAGLFRPATSATRADTTGS